MVSFFFKVNIKIVPLIKPLLDSPQDYHDSGFTVASLMRVFTVHIKNLLVLGYPYSAQERLITLCGCAS